MVLLPFFTALTGWNKDVDPLQALFKWLSYLCVEEENFKCLEQRQAGNQTRFKSYEALFLYSLN